jgi:hypothetical protein
MTRADCVHSTPPTNTPIDPEYIDYVADAIVEATGDLFVDFDVVRKVARAAVEAIASNRRERISGPGIDCAYASGLIQPTPEVRSKTASAPPRLGPFC